MVYQYLLQFSVLAAFKLVNTNYGDSNIFFLTFLGISCGTFYFSFFFFPPVTCGAHCSRKSRSSKSHWRELYVVTKTKTEFNVTLHDSKPAGNAFSLFALAPLNPPPPPPPPLPQSHFFCCFFFYFRKQKLKDENL